MNDKLARTMSGSKCPITNQKKHGRDRIHCNDEPKHKPIHAAQSCYFISGGSKFI
jgi:hypothetical protein